MTAFPPERRRVPWPEGTQVVLRHVAGRRTWCALPVTVLHDDTDCAVFRIHEGSSWAAAFAPDGRRAHGWQRGWRLRRATWRGDDGTYRVEWGRWYGTVVFSDPATGRARKWYVNCQDPLRRTAWGFDTMDRELDVELRPENRSPRWKDLERFRRVVADGRISRHTARLIVEDARRGRSELVDQEFRGSLTAWTARRERLPDFTRVLGAHPIPSDLLSFAEGRDSA